MSLHVDFKEGKQRKQNKHPTKNGAFPISNQIKMGGAHTHTRVTTHPDYIISAIAAMICEIRRMILL